MPYLVDSDWLIDHLAEVPEAVELLTVLAQEGMALSIITYMEVYQGTLRTPDPQASLEQFLVLISAMPVLPCDLEVARRCALLREEPAKGRKAH